MEVIILPNWSEEQGRPHSYGYELRVQEDLHGGEGFVSFLSSLSPLSKKMRKAVEKLPRRKRGYQ